MAVRLIVTDLDGTFLGEGSRLPEANLAAARRALSSDVRFVVATGRPLRWLTQLRELLDLDPVIIASNGACVLHRGRIITQHLLDATAMLAVAEELRRAVPGLAFAVEYLDGWAHEPAYARSPGEENPPRVAQLEELPLRGVLKLLAWHQDVGTEPLAQAVAECVRGRFTSTFSFLSSSGLVELSAPGVTKASTLSGLLRGWKISPGEVAAFGDMPNDLDMLRLAGRAFVPANAHPRLLAAGFSVIGHHDDDGVGIAIERLLDETR
ncbi:MAG: HAD family hydrolase [Propionibacteriaceae bacterium]|nr:HAD family hydrolase [Propionibacteriaceae bacterium]